MLICLKRLDLSLDFLDIRLSAIDALTRALPLQKIATSINHAIEPAAESRSTFFNFK